ncbi:MAG: SUMF1/EgtB/PvdO family nonheme iron enzyme [Halieaceae bacterium]|nr:SUMF1/EgtB/PvdO family nonheme iron enzyme [Halieaceae bacterium]
MPVGVLRGGSWNNNQNNVRSANRNNNTPGNRNNNIGFRCALPPSLHARMRYVDLPASQIYRACYEGERRPSLSGSGLIPLQANIKKPGPLRDQTPWDRARSDIAPHLKWAASTNISISHSPLTIHH